MSVFIDRNTDRPLMDGVWYLNTNRRVLFLGESEAPAYVLTVFIYNALSESVGESVSVCEQVIYKNLNASRKHCTEGEIPQNRIICEILPTTWTKHSPAVTVTEKKLTCLESSSHSLPRHSVQAHQNTTPSAFNVILSGNFLKIPQKNNKTWNIKYF